MPILYKELVPEGTFSVSTANGRLLKQFRAADLTDISNTANSMIAAGLRIPAPFDHHKKAVPETQIELNGRPASAYNNAGYWISTEVRINDKGKPVLGAYLDVPGAADQPDTPYYKAMNSAKEVSISLRDEFEDGLQRKWKNALMHVALVNHAVVPDQKGFEDISAGTEIINMSMIDGDECTSLIEQVKSALQQAFSVTLPSDVVDVRTFLRDVLVAASQHKNSPEGTTLEPVPIYMSIGDNNMLTEVQAQSLVASKAINSATSKPFTMEELGFKPKPNAPDANLTALLAQKEVELKSATAVATALMKKLGTDTAKALQSRIDSLVKAGVVTAELAKATLTPKVEFNMSIDTTTGTFSEHPLEATLSVLESVRPNTTNVEPEAADLLLGNVHIPALSQGGDNEPDMKPEDLQAAMKDMARFLA